jgi:hypothetical protein
MNTSNVEPLKARHETDTKSVDPGGTAEVMCGETKRISSSYQAEKGKAGHGGQMSRTSLHLLLPCPPPFFLNCWC